MDLSLIGSSPGQAHLGETAPSVPELLSAILRVFGWNANRCGPEINPYMVKETRNA